MKSEQSSDNEIEFLDRQAVTKNIPTKFNSKNGHRNHLYSLNKIKHLKIMQKILLETIETKANENEILTAKIGELTEKLNNTPDIVEIKPNNETNLTEIKELKRRLKSSKTNEMILLNRIKLLKAKLNEQETGNFLNLINNLIHIKE